LSANSVGAPLWRSPENELSMIAVTVMRPHFHGMNQDQFGSQSTPWKGMDPCLTRWKLTDRPLPLGMCRRL